jgi:predicted HTH transcriptional regulator
MKKSTLVSLVNYLDGQTVTNLDEIKAELEAELNKGKEKADANRALYEEYHEKVVNALRATPTGVTAQDLADETGISRGKIVYGLTRMWTADIVKDTSGKTTLYRLAE